MSEVGGAAKRSHPASEVGGRPRGATPHPRSGGAAKRTYPESEIRSGGWEDQPHVQGAMAVRVQEGLEELSHIEGQEGPW